MFNFVKDAFCEINHFDNAQIKAQKKSRGKEKKDDKIFLSKSSKILIVVLTAFFAIYNILSFFVLIKMKIYSNCIKSIALSIISIAIIICALSRNKKMEIMSLVGIVIVYLIQFLA